MVRVASFALVCAALSLTACGDDVASVDGGGIDAAPCAVAAADRYLPLKVGTSWSYRITPQTGSPEIKSNTVEAFEDVGGRKAGVMAYRVRTGKIDGNTVSWQEDRCTSVTRHREQSLDLNDTLITDQFYMPDKIRVDETPAHLALGASWTVGYTEIEIDTAGAMTTHSKDETWTVQAVDESITVPAGTFVALKLNKTTSGSADKTYWFAKGVGKLKETGDQLEELMSFTPAP